MGRVEANRTLWAAQLSELLRATDRAGFLLVGAHVAAAIDALSHDRPIRDSDAMNIAQHVADRAVADGGDLQDGAARVLLVAEPHRETVAHQDRDPAQRG